MASFNYPSSFFFPKGDDGNISFQTQQQRIEQACLNLNSLDDYIELEDGTKCFSINELQVALLAKQNSKSASKWSIDRVALLSVAIIFFVLFILGLFHIELQTLRLIASIFGIVIPLFMLKKAVLSKQWVSFFKLVIICSALNVLNRFLPAPILINRIIGSLAYVFLIVGCLSIYRAQNKFVKALPFLLLAIPCIFYIVYMAFAMTDDSRFVVGFAIIRDDMYAIKFGLIAICSFIVFMNPSTLNSSEKYNYGHKAWLALLITVALSAGWCVSDYYAFQDYLEYKNSSPSYKGIHSALDSGDIRYGMLYSEIENICGPADNLSRKNGVIEFAYYGDVQLCFINGRFDHWND